MYTCSRADHVVEQMVDGRLSVSARDFVNARIKVEGADVTVVVSRAPFAAPCLYSLYL